MFAAGTLDAEVFNSAMFSNPRQTPIVAAAPIWVNVMQLRRMLFARFDARPSFFSFFSCELKITAE